MAAGDRCAAGGGRERGHPAWWELARCARDQGRGVDAWRYLALGWSDAGNRRSQRAALCTSLMTGLRRGAPGPRLPDWLDQPLPADVHLAPTLPPPAEPDEDGRPRQRATRAHGLRVGLTLLDLTVTAEPDGVQVDVAHVGGPPCDIRLALPDPGPELTYRARHLDWERVETSERFLAVHLEPDEEPHTLWGRYGPLSTEWPITLPEELPQAHVDGGVRLLGEARATRYAGFAGALAELIGVELHVDSGAGEPTSGLELRFERDGPDAERKLVALCALAETFLLEPSL